MESALRVIGDNSISKEICSALTSAGITADSFAPLLVVAAWSDVEMLRRIDAGHRGPWLLIEDTGSGRIGIGPFFHPEAAGCLNCYLARRRANGGGECRPVSQISEFVLGRIVAAIAAFAQRGPMMSGEQADVASDGNVALHSLLPIPNCSRCGANAVARRTGGPEILVSERFGLIHRMACFPGTPDGTSALQAIGSRTDAFTDQRALNHGLAVDLTQDKARLRAIGESIERYCAAIPPRHAVTARVAELVGSYLSPMRFAAPGAQVDERSVFRWVRAVSLWNDMEVWVPASRVYVPYSHDCSEPMLDIQTSSGLAAAFTLEEAIGHGVMEIVERDTCLRAWRGKWPVERVNMRTITVPGLHMARIPSESGLAVVAAFIEQECRPYTSTGLAARETLEQAAHHATLEAILSRMWLLEWMSKNCALHHDMPRTMVDNAVAHAVRRDLKLFRQRWLSPQRTASLRTDARTWRDLAARMPRACYVDLTTTDVEAAGIKVVRVLDPDRILSDDDAIRPRLVGETAPHPFG
jgi:thiazole/oxazole-forming peptide maturase SagD family component